MSNKKKQLARALVAKTGMSYQSAINVLNKSGPRRQEQPSETASTVEPSGGLDQLLRELGPPFGIAVRRAPAVGVSANLAVAAKTSRQLSQHPIYIAETGAISRNVTLELAEALVKAGAAGEDVQIIRSFKHHLTFSGQCSRCERWIWCGTEDRAAKCFCGHEYRVVFDLTPPDWGLPRSIRCVDCGAEHRLTDLGEDRNPWLPLNEWQIRCNQCVQWHLHNSRVHLELDEQGRQFVRFSSDTKDEVQAFVTNNSLGVDWAEAFVASTGSIGTPRFTRRIELWRLPIVGVGGYERQEIERVIESAKTFERFYGTVRPSEAHRELRERFDRTLRQLVSGLEKELDHRAPETPDGRGRRQVLLGAVRRLLVVAQVGGDTADKAAAVKGELDDVDRAVARTKTILN